MRKFSFILTVLVSSYVNSQTESADLSRAVTDIVFLSEKFVAPAADASIYQATNSWYSSAKSLDLFQVDLSIHANALFIPKRKKNFRISNSDFTSLTIRGGQESVEIPTALGGDNDVFFGLFSTIR